MSEFDPINHIPRKAEHVDFIVPERIREACRARAMDYEEAAEKCEISSVDFGLMANGHKEIPKEFVFNLIRAFDFPAGYWFTVRWERT